MANNYNWNSAEFFENLTQTNKLALDNQFRFCRVSGLQGFEESLETLQTTTAFVCVSDTAPGYTVLNNTPRTRRLKTLFLAMRHALGNMEARLRCMETMRELFRQFMSKLILEKTHLEENFIYLDERITFEEMPEYFFNGCACAHFAIAIDVYTDLSFNEDEWVAVADSNE